jgi:hypothetical protein
MSQVATYLIVESVFTPEPLWLKRIEEFCHIDVKKDRQILNYKSLSQSGVPIFTFGAYCGALFERRVYGIRLLSIYVESRLNLLKFLCRLLITAVLVVPFALPLLLLPWTLHLALLVIVKNLLPAILAGFFMFTFSSYLWKRFNLVG